MINQKKRLLSQFLQSVKSCEFVGSIGTEPTVQLNALTLTSGFLFSMLSIGFSIGNSIEIVAVVVLVTVVGGRIWIGLDLKRERLFSEVIGAGLAIGLALLAFANLVTGPMSPFVVSLIVVCTMLVLVPIHRLPIGLCVQPMSFAEAAIVGMSPLIAFLPFDVTVIVPLFFAATTFFIINSRSWLPHKKVMFQAFSFLALGLVASGIFSMTSLVPPWENAVGGDVLFDESYSFGITQHGLGTSPTVLDEAVNFHFLAHSATGMIAGFMTLPRFAITGAGAYSIGVLGISSLVLSLSWRLGNGQNQRLASLTAALLHASAVLPVFVVPALRGVNGIAMLWALFAFLILNKASKGEIKWPTTIFSISLLASLLSKIHWGLVVLGITATLSAISWLRGLRRQWVSWGATLSVILCIAANLLLIEFRRGDPVAANFEFHLLVGGIAILLFRFSDVPRIVSLRSDQLGTSMVVVAVVVAAAWALGQTSLRTDFFFPALAMVSAASIQPTLFAGFDVYKTHRPRLLVFCGLAILVGYGLALSQVVVSGFRRYEPEIPLSVFNRLWLIDSAAIFSLGVLCFIFLIYKLGRWTNWRSILFVITFLMSIGMFFGHISKPLVHRLLFSVNDFPAEILTTDQKMVGKWLSENTDKSDLIATSSLCPVRVELGMKIPEDDPQNLCNGRNKQSWISATSHRQVLIEAPAYGPLALTTLKDIDLVDRYNSSIEYGLTADSEALEDLSVRGIKWFVVDLQLSKIDDWSSRDSTVFANRSYAIINLDLNGAQSAS